MSDATPEAQAPITKGSAIWLDPTPGAPEFYVESVRLLSNMSNHIDHEQRIVVEITATRAIPTGEKL